MSDQWIVVRNWDRFQHPDVARSDRPPPWVRIYTELHHDVAFMGLPVGTRMLLVHIWLEYASSRRRLPLDTSIMSRRFNLRVTRQQLEALNQAGFIEFSASILQAERKQPASLEESREELQLKEGGSTSTQDQDNGLPISNLEPALELHITQLISSLTGKDNGSATVIRRYAEQLPLGAVAKVHESCVGKPARYAVGALKDELRARGKL